MGSPSLPAQPPPPDYGAATREGITTDIAWLPTRNRINQAAQLGQLVTYTDPVSGEERTADFRGMGNDAAARQAADLVSETNARVQRDQLRLREELGVRNARQTAAELQAADPAAYEAREALTARIRGGLDAPSSALGTDTRAAGSAGRVRELTNQLGDNRATGLLDEAIGNTRLSAGGENTLSALYHLTDANTGGERTLGDIYSRAGDNSGAGNANLTRLWNETRGNPYSARALNPALAGALQDYARGGELSDTERRLATNDVRAGQAARGNYLGDAAIVEEAVRLGNVSDARRQQRLQNLLAIQNQTFGQSAADLDRQAALEGQRFGQSDAALARQAALEGQRFGQADAVAARQAALEGQRFGQSDAVTARKAALEGQRFGQSAQGAGTLAALSGQLFGQGQSLRQDRLAGLGMEADLNARQVQENRATRAENYARDQQNLANASAMVLGQPVTNQFGALAGAQQGAVGFTPINYQGAGQLNANAGGQAANFAQGNFGTLANMWGTSANLASRGNPWMSLLGTGLGAAAGGLGSSWGNRLGGG